MIVIFDLDYTLFDAKRFKFGLAKILGISTWTFDKSYKKHFANEGVNYNVNNHIGILINDKKIKKEDSGKIKERMERYFSSLNKFVFKESKPVLEELTKQGHELILLTYGDSVLQRMKVNNLEIKKYFSKIIVTDKEKTKALSFLKKDPRLKFIINDNARESFAIQKDLPNTKLLIIKGPYSRNVKHITRVHSLQNCMDRLKFEIVKKKLGSTGVKFVLKNDNKEIGRAFIYFMKNDIHDKPFAFIEDVFVEERFRGQGLGTRVFDSLMKEAKDRKCYKVIMTSRYERPKVHKLYTRLGFKDWGKEFRMDL